MVDGRLTVLVYGTRTAPAADGETRQTFGGNRRSVWSGATPRRRRITALFTYYCEGNCYGVVVVGRFSPDLVDERPPVDPRAGTNATTRTLGGAVGQVKLLGITWQPPSGTNCVLLPRRFAPTWHPELRRSTRGGGRSKMTGSPRSPYEGNLTVAAHGVGAFYPHGRSQKPLLCFGSGAVLAHSLGKSAHTWQRRTRG